MTQAEVIEQDSIAKQDENLDIPFMLCLVEGKTVTKRQCMATTTNREKNKICITSNCMSFLKACPTCLKIGDVEKMGHILTVCCEKRKNACSFHVRYPGAHRSESERKEDIQKHLKMLAEKKALQESMQAVDESRTGFLIREEEKRISKARQNVVQSRERQEEYRKNLQSDGVHKNRIELIAEAVRSKSINSWETTGNDDISELPIKVQIEPQPAEQTQTAVMFEETITEMSQVELLVEKQKDSSEELTETEVEAKPYEDHIEAETGVEAEAEVTVPQQDLQDVSPEAKVFKKQAVSSPVIKFSCPLRTRKKMIGEQRCVTFCSKFINNKKCQEVGCKSPWRICVACLGHGEYPRYGKECYVFGLDEKTEQMLCKTHLEIGYQNKREDYKKSSLVSNVDVRKLPPHTGAVQEVVEKVVTANLMTKGNEQRSELEKEKEATQRESHSLRSRNSKLLSLAKRLIRQEKLLQDELAMLQKKSGSDESNEVLLKENARLEARIGELEETLASKETLLAEKESWCKQLEAKVKGLQEEKAEIVSLSRKKKSCSSITAKPTAKKKTTNTTLRPEKKEIAGIPKKAKRFKPQIWSLWKNK